MLIDSLKTFFYIDSLSLIMIFLVGFIGLVVYLFALRYMQGDSQYTKFLSQLSILILTVIVIVAADNLFLMLLAWSVSNILLIRLMIHKPNWRAALNSGLLTAKVFALGILALAAAFYIMYYQTGETSIRAILQLFNLHDPFYIPVLLLILIAALTQSAIWPFHRWLVSSLNSPTPVSAIMHAGIVNGGGFLLVRFGPLYLQEPRILTLIFILGIITACVGTLWKLMQNDVKRMLACSTMGQMGFMLAQCGMGLFPAAIAHLCWHGMFKANLFLSANSIAKKNQVNKNEAVTVTSFLLAIFSGLIASYFFSIALHSTWYVNNTLFILIALSFITASQFSMSLLINASCKRLPMVVLLSAFIAYLYGYSVYTMENVFQSMNIFHPQPLNIFHLLTIFFLTSMWVLTLLKDKVNNTRVLSFLQIMYIKTLNASQPHPSTITSHRNQYHY